MTDIAAYLAANGITTQDDDVIWWARSAAREMVNQIEESGGFENPSTSVLYEPIRWDLQDQCPKDSFVCIEEWYKSEAQSRGVPQLEIPSLVMSSAVQMEHEVFERFGKATVVFDLVPYPTGGDDVEINPESTEEGELFRGLAMM
jgi:hypothetical protein